MDFIKEAAWRIFYIATSILITFSSCYIYGDLILETALDPCRTEWQLGRIQYNHPDDVSWARAKIAFTVSIIINYPIALLHLIIYLANSLTRKELKTLIYYGFFSLSMLIVTIYILLELKLIGSLLDLGQTDDDLNVIYMPDLNTYVNNWLTVSISAIIASQLPLIWFKMHNGKASRVQFIFGFFTPSVVISYMMFAEPLIGIAWLISLRLVYLIVNYIAQLISNYKETVTKGELRSGQTCPTVTRILRVHLFESGLSHIFYYE